MADTQFSIRIQNLDQILATFQQAPSIVAPRISDAINKSLAILAKNGDESTFQFKTPRDLRTGYLSASWGAPGRGLTLASPSNLSGKIWTNAGYAIYVHEGTAPHVIRVKVKKVLANKKTGQVFGKEDCRKGLSRAMPKEKIHPNYAAVQVKCACGNNFETRSTHKGDIHVEICSVCHPFFTGKQRLVDTAGRVERFRRKYAKSDSAVAAAAAK